MPPFDCVVHGDAPPFELNGDGRFTLSRDTYVNVMDQYYPAHKAETEPRFAEINRGITDNEFCSALELARKAGLWRFNTRWSHRRGMVPQGAPVWLPRRQDWRIQLKADPVAAFAILA